MNLLGCTTSAVVFLLTSLLQVASGQFILYNGNQAQIVFGSRGLLVALQNEQLPLIVLQGNVTLDPTSWITPPVIANRSLLFAGDENHNSTAVLDFSGILGAIIIGEGADVEFRNITMMGAGPQNLTNPSNYTKYKASGLGVWPSLIVLSDAEVFFNNTLLQYYSQIVWSQCVDFAQKVSFQLQLLGYHSVTSAVPGSVTLSELYNATVNVTDITTNDVVGQVYLSSVNTTMDCVTDPYAQDHSLSGEPLPSSGGGFKWWYGLLIAVGVVALLGLGIGLALVVIVRRRRQAQSKGQLPVANGERDLMGPTPPVLATVGSTTSEEAKAGSLRPSSSIAATQPSADLDGMRGPIQSQVSLEAPGSSAIPSGSTERSEFGTENRPSGGGLAGGSQGGSQGRGSLGQEVSGAASSPVPWLDVTALLRARSDFTDIEVGPMIGRGSFGRVYKGRWKGAFVAIKVVDHQEAATKLIAMREGALSHSVQHPNVITTYSVFLQKTPMPDVRQREDWGGEREPPEDALEGVPERAEPSFTEQHEQFATCMVLEYADRGTLEKAVVSGKFRDRGTRLPDLKAIHRTLLDIAGGMDYLHSVGVLHGDLKGANVLLKSTATDSRGFTCKLADFGMARLLDSDRTHVSTQTYGTISYMPAELLKEGKLTRAVDTYSFAILMWELFSGQILHTGLTMAQVFYKVCYEEHKPPMPEHMPGAYADLMVRCWDTDSTKRPTFTEVMAHLQGLPTLRAPAGGASAIGSPPPIMEGGGSQGSSAGVASPFSPGLHASLQSLSSAPASAPAAAVAEEPGAASGGPNPFADAVRGAPAADKQTGGS